MKLIIWFLSLLTLGCSQNGTSGSGKSCNEDFVTTSPISAARQPQENWQDRFERDENVPVRPGNVKAHARPYSSGVDLSALPAWPWGDRKLLEAFVTARDERPYTQKGFPDFKRRTPWLFPFDGCWVRAASAAQSIERSGVLRPGKIFVFGPLRYRTKFAKRGIVYWWYHVAAAYRIGDEAVIIDPTVSPNSVLTLHQWLTAITNNPNKVRLSICDTYAYYTGSRCIGGEPRQERWLPGQVQRYLAEERTGVIALGLDPRSVLGDSPPWLESSTNLTDFAPAVCE